MRSDAHLPCPDRYKATMIPTYRLGAGAAAMAVESAKRAATYLRKYKPLVDTEINAGGPPTKGTHAEKNSDAVWHEDTPRPIPNMVQIELSDLKIKINLKDYKKQTGSEMAAKSEECPVRAKAVLEMMLPSKNNDTDHRWEIDAKCFGVHLVVHNAKGDKIEQSRCSFLAMARMAGISPEELFDEVRKAAQKYLANMEAITGKFKKILTAEVLRNMERHSCRTLANIVEPSMESNLF